jgi:hypothetical protein
MVIAGAGKTKLVSKVVDSLTNRPHDQALAYFYCFRGDESRRQPENVLRSLVRQLSVRKEESTITLQKPLVQLYREKEAEAFASGAITFDESEKLLLQLFKAYSHTTLVLDALDECDQDLRGRLIQVFERLINVSKKLKIFISSRRDDDIRLQLEKKANVGTSVSLWPWRSQTTGQTGADPLKMIFKMILCEYFLRRVAECKLPLKGLYLSKC